MHPIILFNNIHNEYNLNEKTKDLKDTLSRKIKEGAKEDGSELLFGVAYIKNSGINPYLNNFEQILSQNGRIKILTCFDFGLTDPLALKKLIQLKKFGDIEVHFYQNTKGNYHPKFYLFNTNNKRGGIIGSNNFTYSALNDNIELAVLINDQESIKNLESYFYSLWQKSVNINAEIIDEYSTKYNKLQIEREKTEKEMKQLAESFEERVISDPIDEEEIETIISQIKAYFNIPSGLLFWRDVAPDEVGTLLYYSSKEEDFDAREFVIDLIRNDCLHYKSESSIGAWLNYRLFMETIGYWDDYGLTKWGKIALDEYRKSGQGFLAFLQFSILVSGEIYRLISVLNQANSEIKHIINSESRLLKGEWIDLVYPIICEKLAKYGADYELGEESFKRYLPSLFNKFGLGSYIYTIIPTVYEIKIHEISHQILNYGQKFKLKSSETQNDFIGDL